MYVFESFISASDSLSAEAADEVEEDEAIWSQCGAGAGICLSVADDHLLLRLALM